MNVADWVKNPRGTGAPAWGPGDEVEVVAGTVDTDGEVDGIEDAVVVLV